MPDPSGMLETKVKPKVQSKVDFKLAFSHVPDTSGMLETKVKHKLQSKVDF